MFNESYFQVKYKDELSQKQIDEFNSQFNLFISQLDSYELSANLETKRFIAFKCRTPNTKIYLKNKEIILTKDNWLSLYHNDKISINFDYNLVLKSIKNFIKYNSNNIFYYDILLDRDDFANFIYVIYFKDCSFFNYDSNKDKKEKLIYLKWSTKTKKIIAFHSMKSIHNRDLKLAEVYKMKEDVQCGGAIANVLPTSNKKPKKQPQKISYLKTAKICCEDENLWTFKYDDTEIKFNATCEKFGRALRKIRDFDKDDTYQNMAREIQDSDGEWFEIECDENKLPKNYSDMLKLF